ncbi:MAG: TlyA family RNA methyltransferase [Hyphomicrobiaceae bacterium]|nr:TlyA family RNA methyltransferase [Hyphomicrobiaceae bacterium]
MRLDRVLVARGLAATRSRARDLIARRCVMVDGATVTRPGVEVGPETEVSLAADARAYVSRGAVKLLAALAHFGFESSGVTALDVGASTGGFTQVLLEAGARRIYAVDVGRGQLDPALRQDARVVSLEGTDARSLTRAEVPEPVGAVVADVSFISLGKALPVPLSLAAPGAWLVALIKPQFEAGREAVGKGGIVRDPADRERAVNAVRDWLARQAGWTVAGVVESPLLGGSGNQEFLIGARRHD